MQTQIPQNLGSLIAQGNAQLTAKAMAGLQLNSKVARDSLNITNSIIVSNSQILFHDMGNGKIVPVPI